MLLPLRLLLCLAVAGSPKPDPEAMREASRAAGPHLASPRAIGHYLEARRLERDGDLEGAARELRAALAFDASSAELHVALARLLLDQGRVEPAEEELSAALASGARGTTRVDAQVLAARAAVARRDPARAEAALREATRLSAAEPAPDPEPWRLLAELEVADRREGDAEATLDDLARHLPAAAAAGRRELGRRALDEDDPARAERHLRRAVALDAGDAETFRLLAAALEALRRPAEARDVHLAVLRLEPDAPESLLALGRLALAAQELEDAREWFRRFLRASPDAGDAWVRVAFAWLDDVRPAEALAAARAGLAEAAPDPRLRVAEGLALRELRRWSEAATAFEPVPPAAGDVWVAARAGMGDALSRAGRHAEADRLLSAALARRPGEPRFLVTRARAWVRVGRTGDAVRALGAAVEAGREGDGADLEVALADALASDGKGEEALAVLGRGLLARPGDPGLSYALAATLERLGRREEALGRARALVAATPDDVEAMNLVAYLLAEDGASLDEAERLARRALALEQRAGHVHDTLGWVLHRRGDEVGALAALDRALELAGPDPVLLEHRGDVLRALGRDLEAARAWRDAIRERGDGSPSEEARRRRALEGKIRALARGPRHSLTPAAARR